MNDATTAQGNHTFDWKTTAQEFVPKDLNQLTAQSQLPSSSQLPVNATAETAFLKLTFRHHNLIVADGINNSYLTPDANNLHHVGGSTVAPI